jgi:hypothetical protein
VALLTLGGLTARAAEEAAPEEGIEVQARGPVHEAYAQPSQPSPEPGPVITKRPPDPVPEEPPDQKPEGDNVQWIPGYWAWDTDRQDFLWVSGMWRVPPPDRRWMPGRWAEVDGGWQWVSGFWAPTGEEEVPYQPAPPRSLDVGPAVPAPDDDSIYVPGSWVFRTSRYLWRPGFWQAARPGWLWNPAHYCWTPGGYVFVDGYWDYPLEDRGLLFAPVCFNQPLWQSSGWRYRPRFCLGVDGLLNSLFCRPSCGHYYFGDYYDPGYARLGFRPWFQYGPRTYDPLFGYYRWAHRDNPGWFRGLRDVYLGRRNGNLVRPPRTFAAQNALFRQHNFTRNVNRTNLLRVVTPLSQWQRNHGLVRRGAPERARQRTFATQLHKRGLERTHIEKSHVLGKPTRQQTHRQGSRAFNPPRHQPAHALHQSIKPAGRHVPSHQMPHAAKATHHAPAHHAAPAPPKHHAAAPAHHRGPAAPRQHSAPAHAHSSPRAPRHQATHHAPAASHHAAHSSSKHHR